MKCVIKYTIRLFVALVCGMLTTWAVAWWCAKYASFSEAIQPDNSSTITMFEPFDASAPVHVLDSHGLRGAALLMREASVSGKRDSQSVTEYVLIFDAGWPLLSHRAEWRGSGATPASITYVLEHGYRTDARTRDGQYFSDSFVYPTHLLWPSFLINTLLYAGLVWTLMLLPGRIRRIIRRRSNRCVQCGYPRGEAARCSECGEML